MGYFELFALIGVVTLIAMLCWGKFFDRGLPTDRERVIFPGGPEHDDDENLAEVSSPFTYDSQKKAITEDVDQTEVSKDSKNIKLPAVNKKTEVRLDEYLKNKSGTEASSR